MKRLSSDLKSQSPVIPWQDIAGMRDKLIHDYFGVDIDTVWLTAKKDIPQFKEEIRRIIAKLESRLNMLSTLSSVYQFSDDFRQSLQRIHPLQALDRLWLLFML